MLKQINKAIRTETFDFTNQDTTKESCSEYISNRSSSYEFRSIRYEAVLDSLKLIAFSSGDFVLDVGGADGEFGKYLQEQGIDAQYKVVDGMIDGTNLNNWIPRDIVDYIVSIEVIEHLESPKRFLSLLDNYANKGIVITTPNPHVVDVKSMDKTHISPTYPSDFYKSGYKVFPSILFFESGDSLIGIKDKRFTLGI